MAIRYVTLHVLPNRQNYATVPLHAAAAVLREGCALPGRPFQKGHDPRRNVTGGSHGNRAPTARVLARAEREASIKALVALRDAAGDERIALEAAKTLLAYSDGKPTDAAPGEDEETKDETPPAEILQLLKGGGQEPAP